MLKWNIFLRIAIIMISTFSNHTDSSDSEFHGPSFSKKPFRRIGLLLCFMVLIFSVVTPSRKSFAISHSQNIEKGDITDGIVMEMFESRCIRQALLKTALEKSRNQEWKKAISDVNAFLEIGPPEACLDTAVFLKAYCIYKKADSENKSRFQEAADFCRDAIHLFPDSTYVPYGMTILGMIHLKLNIPDMAQGYFKFILKKYPCFKGTPELLFRLGQMNAREQKYNEAVADYHKIITDYPESNFMEDARLELGKALFEVNHFSEALYQFNTLLSSNPQRRYENSDLLVYLGNSYYQTGNYAEARKTLETAYNLFPEMDLNHIVLARIADIFSDEKQFEKAKKLYRLVAETYPGTDGCIISNIRLAAFHDTRAGKEQVYQKIIEKHPNNPLANLARLRIAEIQVRAHEYEKALATIHGFLAQHPRNLKKEALYLKREALEGVFQEMSGTGNFPGILKLYEKEKVDITYFESPELFYLLGQSYYEGHLYEKAEELLLRADHFFEKAGKPDKLNFLLGVALQESEKPEKAYPYFNEYIRQQPEGEHSAEALKRIACIQMQKGEYATASENFRIAFQKAGNEFERAGILIEHAELTSKNKQYHESVDLMLKAIHILNAVPEKHNVMISQAYQTLGKMYMNLKSFQRAANSFLLAIQVSKKEAAPSLRFMLAESFLKGGNTSKAVEIYKNLLHSDELFWKKLAEEKLSEINLIEKIQKYEA